MIGYDATAFIYIGEICAYLLNQPDKDTDREHKVRVIAGNGLRPAIWDEFTKRFGIARVCEFYAASEGNTAFINVFNVDKTTGICPTPMAFVEYDDETGDPMRDDDGRVRKVAHGEPGLLLSKVSSFQPFDGYTDKEATEKKLVRNAFREGDVLVQHRRPDALAGLRARRVHRPARRHVPLEGRERRHHRGRGRGVDRLRRSRRPRCSASRCPTPAAGGHGRASSCKDGQEFDGKALAKAVYEHSARLRGAAVRAGRRVARAHVDVQEPEGRPAQGGLRR